MPSNISKRYIEVVKTLKSDYITESKMGIWEQYI